MLHSIYGNCKNRKPTQKITLSKNDMYIISEKMTVKYDTQNFRGNVLPSINSFLIFDVNDSVNWQNVVDVNYLFLNGSSNGNTSGQLVYIVMKKPFPTEFQSARKEKIKQKAIYNDINYIGHLVFGYWIIKDKQIILAFMDKTKVEKMSQLSIFNGLKSDNEIDLISCLNVKDETLSEDNKKFRKLKYHEVDLSIKLEKIFTASLINGDTLIKTKNIINLDSNYIRNTYQKSRIKLELLSTIKYVKYDNFIDSKRCPKCASLAFSDDITLTTYRNSKFYTISMPTPSGRLAIRNIKEKKFKNFYFRKPKNTLTIKCFDSYFKLPLEIQIPLYVN